MKKLCVLLVLALLLSLSASAFADNGVEILYMDGTPVVVESPSLTAGETAAFNAPGAGLTLPAALVAIEEEAFEGIDAARVASPSPPPSSPSRKKPSRASTPGAWRSRKT